MKSTVVVASAIMKAKRGKAVLIAPNRVRLCGLREGMGKVSGFTVDCQHLIGWAWTQNEVSSMKITRRLFYSISTSR